MKSSRPCQSSDSLSEDIHQQLIDAAPIPAKWLGMNSAARNGHSADSSVRLEADMDHGLRRGGRGGNQGREGWEPGEGGVGTRGGRGGNQGAGRVGTRWWEGGNQE